MKASPLRLTDDGYSPCKVSEATHVMLNVPGPVPTRILPIRIGQQNAEQNGWEWNGDVDKPTLSPSILTRAGSEQHPIVCHSYVRNGMIEFLNDCTHSYAGKTVELLEVD